jgi:uncharacterized protein
MEPWRTCVGCGKKAPKGTLRRLALDSSGQPVVDPGQTAIGRGAYLCGAGCLKAAVKRKAFQRAFRGKAGSFDLERLAAALN